MFNQSIIDRTHQNQPFSISEGMPLVDTVRLRWTVSTSGDRHHPPHHPPENILFILTMMYYSNIKFERYEGALR
nr:hypothetical protein [Neobacillus sp. 179.-C4.2 HS]